MISPRLKMCQCPTHYRPHGPFTFLSRLGLGTRNDRLKTKKYWTEVKMFSLIASVEIWTAVFKIWRTYGGFREDSPSQNLCSFFVYRECRYCDKTALVRNHLVDVLNEKSSKEPKNLKMLKFFQLHFICFHECYMKIHRQLTKPTVPFYTASPPPSVAWP